MSNCQHCGYELEAGAVFCWGCGKNDPLPGAKRASSGCNKSSKLIATIAGGLVAFFVVFAGLTYLFTSLSTDTTNEITPEVTPTPTPSEDGGIKKQNGNASTLPGQTLTNPATKR